LLLKRRVYRTFPAFFVYLCWSLFSDTFFYYARAHYSAAIFFRISEVQLALDSAMIFALLVEVAWNILRPIRNSLPKYSWIWIAGLVALGGLVLWPIAGFAAPDNLNHQGMDLFRLQQTPAILRAVFFLALAGFSQVLSIGWRDRELQIATGLGFYSIISLAVTIMHVHQASGTAQYYWLDVLGEVSYLAALVYWVYAFATQTVERREFTPQMQSMLLAVAGSARSARVELSGSVAEESSRKNER
jgi:hypothetical protein